MYRTPVVWYTHVLAARFKMHVYEAFGYTRNNDAFVANIYSFSLFLRFVTKSECSKREKTRKYTQNRLAARTE